MTPLLHLIRHSHSHRSRLSCLLLTVAVVSTAIKVAIDYSSLRGLAIDSSFVMAVSIAIALRCQLKKV